MHFSCDLPTSNLMNKPIFQISLKFTKFPLKSGNPIYKHTLLYLHCKLNLCRYKLFYFFITNFFHYRRNAKYLSSWESCTKSRKYSTFNDTKFSKFTVRINMTIEYPILSSILCCDEHFYRNYNVDSRHDNE